MHLDGSKRLDRISTNSYNYVLKPGLISKKTMTSEIIGLWKLDNNADANKNTCTLLLTRRPNLAVWERSKNPVTDEEKEVRRKLSKRYDLCDWTTVYTTTLLTANDVSDDVRWS